MDLVAIEAHLHALMRRDAPLPPPVEPTDTDSALAAGLRAHFAGDYPAVTRAATVLTDTASDALERTLAAALHGYSVAGDLDVLVRDVWSPTLSDLAAAPDDRAWALARFLVTESALAAAHVEVAVRAHATGPAPHLAWTGHPVEVYLLASAVRVAAFSGALTQAATQLDLLVDAGGRHGLTDLSDAVRALVSANADLDGTGELVAGLLDRDAPPRDALERGAFLLAAFAADALHDKALGAALILRADVAPDLPHATLIDRALGLETLSAAAVAVDDAVSAEAWLDELEELSGHPIVDPPLHRARSRLAALRGDHLVAVAEATTAVEKCERAGRAIEAAESRMVLAGALVGAGRVAEASRLLRTGVAGSDERGHAAVRREASRLLRPVGRRLPPRASGGWEVLSDREAQVARLVLEGHDPRAIAEQLFLSPATVRTHVSRVLAAFGVGTRVALLAHLGPLGSSPPKPALTPRQSAVVELVATGRSNAEIAEALALTVKSVEKHVGDAIVRWDVSSRFDLALHWLRDRC